MTSFLMFPVYRRLFTEGTSTCLGNKTAFSLIQKNMEYCLRVNTSNFCTITNSELCKKINALRNCDADYAASICNDLQRWYIDRSWKALIEVYYRFCKGTLNPPAYNLPFRRSQPSRGQLIREIGYGNSKSDKLYKICEQIPLYI
ncbi:hypothetical protein RRG08_055880 [Elysia crispata]|uniref:Uncharacterized protein n=1 Tax=Elysia crispata TaxID=231223 RepID=A0AAE1A6R5_9GAST|nr:hypothetical protein RRG08_055880 [Elysia crispata]